MNPRRTLRFCFALLSALAVGAALAAAPDGAPPQDHKPDGAPEKPESRKFEPFKPESVTSSGSVTVGASTLAGSSNARKVVSIPSGGSLTLTTTFAFSSTTAMTIAGTFNGAFFGSHGSQIGIAIAGAGTAATIDTRFAGVVVGKKN